MITRRFKQLLPTRFNRDRINSNISNDNPDLSRLLDLADGMQVPVLPGFKPNGQSECPKLRHKYKIAHAPVNKMFNEIWEAGLAIYLPMSTAKEVIGSHFSPAH